MANNLRTLKKDIDYLVDEAIADCCTFRSFRPETEETVYEIIDEVVTLRNNLYSKVNNRQDNPAKPYFKAIKEELIAGVDAAYDRLSSLIKKEAK